MESINSILVISRMNPYSRKAIKTGISLARNYEAKLHVLHLVSNPVDTIAQNSPGLFPEAEYENYRNSQQEAKEQLDKIIKQEIRNGYPITELVSDRDPVEEIMKIVSEKMIDLIIMPAHEEGRIEHVLFGGNIAAIIRRKPCSLLLVKNEKGPVEW